MGRLFFFYYSEGGFLDRQNSVSEKPKTPAFSPILPSKTVITYVDDDTTDSLTERSHQAAGSIYDIPNYETPVPQVNLASLPAPFIKFIKI